MLCGSRALLDYEIKDENAKKDIALLCAKEYEVAGRGGAYEGRNRPA